MPTFQLTEHGLQRKISFSSFIYGRPME